MKTAQIRKIARAAGAVSFKLIKGKSTSWLACYSATTKEREEMMVKMQSSGLICETGHFGNQVDVEL